MSGLIPEGFIPWSGGDNPVPDKTVQVLCRNGAVSVKKSSSRLVWHHVENATESQLLGGPCCHIDEDFDIIAYHVVEPDKATGTP